MATLTRDEQATVAGTSRSLESIAEELLEAASLAENIEDDADTLDRIVRLLSSAEGSLRWLHGDLDRLNDTVQERGDVCEECGTELCASCGECPACGECCVFEGDPDIDDDFPLSLEYDDDSLIFTERPEDDER